MRYADWEYILLDTVDSTNLYAKKLHKEGMEGKAIIQAKEQTRGRGRMDRRWSSPAGSGIWFTLLCKPEIPAESAPRLVFCAALAVCDALRRLSGGDFMIKWPNDIVINGKKVCGILAECGFSGAELDFAAIGIGINLTSGALPEELIYASGVFEETGENISYDAFFGAFIPLFDGYMETFEKSGLNAIMDELKERMVTLGKQVRIDGNVYFAERMDDTGELIVRGEDGAEHRILAGDVSVRGITDYA